MSLTRVILFIVLGLHIRAVAEEPTTAVEITRFALNPAYGVSQSLDPASGNMSWFRLWIATGDDAGQNGAALIDSVMAISWPQLCDSNAVSYVVQQSTDSAALVVKKLNSSTPLDTIIAFPVERIGSAFSWAPGTGGRLYNMGQYLFYRPDSLLFWQLPQVRRSIIEFGRIAPDGSYQSFDGCFECGVPTFSGDFSMALYYRFPPLPTDGPWTIMLAYDFEQDTSFLLQEVNAACSSPQLLHRGDQLYCICDDTLRTYSICVLEDSIPRPMFSVKYPITFCGYEIYPDSIVARTKNCCDKDYGVQSHVVRR